jgi:hypothetical protein
VRTGFDLLVSSLGGIDIFLHDSDHAYWHQIYELRCVAAHLREGALVICDDADSSFGFLDFCREALAIPHFLAGR